MFRNITKTVLIISLVSLFNDASSEMLYPIIPLYLAQIGYGSLIIGILEGFAEFLSGVSKIYMGSLSDSYQKRLPFVQIGYALSILSRPIIGMSHWVALIFASRSADRIGKGIRSGARDAMLADESNEQNRAEIFGFHRSLDTLGAIIGPLIAMVFLYYYPLHYKEIFLITIVPGILSLGLTFLIKEKKKASTLKVSVSMKEHLSYIVVAPTSFKKFMIPLFIFSLVNSSDMFLLHRAKEIGYNEQQVLTLYLLFNCAYALAAFPIGKLADRFSRMKTLQIGLLLYAIAYFIFSSQTQGSFIYIAFIIYGLFYAFTHGIIKTLLIQRIEKNEKSRAIGFYEGFNSFGLLIANAVAGSVWYALGAHFLFLSVAVIVSLVAFSLFFFNENEIIH